MAEVSTGALDGSDCFTSCINAVVEGFKQACAAMMSVIRWCCASFANLGIWLFDKILFGAPALRQYTGGGLFPSDFSDDGPTRQWMHSNTGVDIYNTLRNGVVDNILGFIFGYCTGISLVYTLLSHTLYSFGNLIAHNYNFLNQQEPQKRSDGLQAWYQSAGRNNVMTIIGNLLSVAIVLPIIVVTNIIAGFFTSLYYMAHPVLFGLNRTWSDTKDIYNDRRLNLSQVMFGVLTAPIWAPIGLVTNLVGGFFYSLVHLIYAFGGWFNRSQARSGEANDEAMKADTRARPARYFFGALTAPIWFPITLISNLVIGICISLGKAWESLKDLNYKPYEETWESIKRIASYDERGDIAKWTFAILSSPFWVSAAIIGHTVVGICHSIGSMVKTFYMALHYDWLAPQSTENGQEQPFWAHVRQAWQDDTRTSAAKFLFAVLSVPIWLPVVVVTNIVCGLFLSFVNQVKAFWNLTNRSGTETQAIWQDDKRHWLVKSIFGFLTAPVWLPIACVTNPVSGLLQSIYYNIRALWDWEAFSKEKTTELLGEDERPMASRYAYGGLTFVIWAPIIVVTNIVAGALRSIYHLVRALCDITDTKTVINGLYDQAKLKLIGDNRGFVTKFLFGLVSFPVWFPIVVFTNAICGSIASVKNQVRAFWNITNQSWSQTKDVWRDDKRHWLVKGIFGFLTAPVWIPIACVANPICGIGQSIYRGVRALWDVEAGTFSDTAKWLWHDRRPLGFRVVYGFISAFVVLPIVVCTNIVCGLARSLYSMVGGYFNLLGENGLFGKRRSIEDKRHSVVKGIFGFVTMPLWLPAVVITNVFDGIGALLYKHKLHAVAAVGMVVGFVLSPFAFVFRKSFGRMYTAIRRQFRDPGSDKVVDDRPASTLENALTFGKGLLGLFTLGILPAIMKYCFKNTSHRVKQMSEHCTSLETKHGGDWLAKLNSKFSECIRKARSGIFPQGEDWAGRARPVLRFAGFRSRVESIIKIFSNALLLYLKLNQDEFTKQGFMTHNLFQVAKARATAIAAAKPKIVDSVLSELELSPQSTV